MIIIYQSLKIKMFTYVGSFLHQVTTQTPSGFLCCPTGQLSGATTISLVLQQLQGKPIDETTKVDKSTK